jgi:hypothetical protein
MDVISLAPADFVERRATRRAACGLDVTVRQRGCFAVAGSAADLTTNGCRVAGAGPFKLGSEIWVRLPGIESQTARVIWSKNATTGVAFERALHPAVYARFLPAAERMKLVSATPSQAVPDTRGEPDRQGAVAQGLFGGQRSPLRLLKQPAGGGLAGAINRGLAGASGSDEA